MAYNPQTGQIEWTPQELADLQKNIAVSLGNQQLFFPPDFQLEINPNIGNFNYYGLNETTKTQAVNEVNELYKDASKSLFVFEKEPETIKDFFGTTVVLDSKDKIYRYSQKLKYYAVLLDTLTNDAVTIQEFFKGYGAPEQSFGLTQLSKFGAGLSAQAGVAATYFGATSAGVAASIGTGAAVSGAAGGTALGAALGTVAVVGGWFFGAAAVFFGAVEYFNNKQIAKSQQATADLYLQRAAIIAPNFKKGFEVCELYKNEIEALRNVVLVPDFEAAKSKALLENFGYNPDRKGTLSIGRSANLTSGQKWTIGGLLLLFFLWLKSKRK